MGNKRIVDQQLNLAAEGKGSGWAIPVPGKRTLETLRASAVCPATGAWETTVPVDVWKSRLIHLYIKITAAATGNVVTIIPEVNTTDETGDVSTFYPISVTDGSPSDTDLTVAPTGYSGNNFGALTFRPLCVRNAPTDNGTQTIFMVIPIDVTNARTVRVQLAETGVTGTPATVQIKYTKSA